jgi:hypothetical protein
MDCLEELGKTTAYYMDLLHGHIYFLYYELGSLHRNEYTFLATAFERALGPKQTPIKLVSGSHSRTVA